MYVLGLHKFKCFVYPASLFCISHSIDIYLVVIKNIRNMHAASTNQTADILHFNDKGPLNCNSKKVLYLLKCKKCKNPRQNSKKISYEVK